MKRTTKLGLAYALAIASLMGISLGAGWLAAPVFKKQDEACQTQCSGRGLQGSVQGVQVVNPRRPGMYLTEWQCVCQ